jgi:carbon storage regulator
MLVLSRKPGEKVTIGHGITVTVVEIIGNRVRLGITAPDNVHILRGELVEWQQAPSRQNDSIEIDVPFVAAPR